MFKNKKHYHFSGICGTAMASIAVLLKKKGFHITGSDTNIYPPMSTYLQENQIPICTGYDSKHLNPHPDVVVLGNVLSRGNPEVEYTLSQHLKYVSLAELVKEKCIRGNHSIVCTGTHGKTTTTSLLAHIFDVCGKKPGFLIGGIPENFGISARSASETKVFITEGDEYDTSFFDKRSKFFHYLPDQLVINNIEFDHADIFDSLEEIKLSFIRMLRQVPRDGLILVNGDDAHAMDIAKQGFTPILSFGEGNHCDVIISHYQGKSDEGTSSFQLTWNEKTTQWKIPLMGMFNARNATVAILLGMLHKFSQDKIQTGLLSFLNAKRRLQKITSNHQISVFDDFAHHPTAILETIKALKTRFPNQKIHAVYEPRSNTSVRNFHEKKMETCFQDADTVVFYKLHREEYIPKSERLNLKEIVITLDKQGKLAKIIPNLEEIIEFLYQLVQPNDIVLIMSQGSFGGIQKKLALKLDQKYT